MKHKLFPGFALALFIAGASPATAQSADKQEGDNLSVVLSWYRDVITFRHVEMASKYMAPDYVEHAATIGTNLAQFVDYYGKVAPQPIGGGPIPSVYFAKGDYVVLVWERPDNDPKTGTPYKYFVYDVVRVKNGKIQEHWDSVKKGLTLD